MRCRIARIHSTMLSKSVITNALLHHAVTVLTDVTMYCVDTNRYRCVFMIYIVMCFKDNNYEQTYLCFMVSLVDIFMSCHWKAQLCVVKVLMDTAMCRDATDGYTCVF